MKYGPKIPAAELVHGEYYIGRCRNATIARWNGKRNVFVHWRKEFDCEFLEEIKHPEHETRYDVFVVERVAKQEEIVKHIDLVHYELG